MERLREMPARSREWRRGRLREAAEKRRWNASLRSGAWMSFRQKRAGFGLKRVRQGYNRRRKARAGLVCGGDLCSGAEEDGALVSGEPARLAREVTSGTYEAWRVRSIGYICMCVARCNRN